MPYKDPHDRSKRDRDRYAAKTQPKSAVDDKLVLFQVRLKSSLVGRLHKIMIEAERDGSYLWKNRAHMAEDLFMRGLESFNDAGAVEQGLQFLKAISHTRVLAGHRREAQGAFSEVKTEILEMLAVKQWDMAIHHYKSTYRAFEEGMDPNIWRDWFLTELEKTFPKLHAAKVPLLNMDAEDHDEKRALAIQNRLKIVSPKKVK